MNIYYNATHIYLAGLCPHDQWQNRLRSCQHTQSGNACDRERHYVACPRCIVRELHKSNECNRHHQKQNAEARKDFDTSCYLVLFCDANKRYNGRIKGQNTKDIGCKPGILNMFSLNCQWNCWLTNCQAHEAGTTNNGAEANEAWYVGFVGDWFTCVHLWKCYKISEFRFFLSFLAPSGFLLRGCNSALLIPEFGLTEFINSLNYFTFFFTYWWKARECWIGKTVLSFFNTNLYEINRANKNSLNDNTSNVKFSSHSSKIVSWLL